MKITAVGTSIVATNIDTLARGTRIRALRELESVCEHSVLPISVVAGEGLDELWKLIDSLVNKPRHNSSSPSSRQPLKATARPRLTRLTKLTGALHPQKK